MSLSCCLLGFLAYRDMTGYDLAKQFDSSVRFFWYAQNSHIYLELNKLEEKGYVSCTLIEQSDRPNKKRYSITPAGREAFLDWLSDDQMENPKGTKNAFLMKVFFSGNQSPAQSVRMLRAFREDCRKRLAQLPDPHHIAPGDASQYDALYWSFTADFGCSYLHMCMDWADRCIHHLEEWL